MTAPLTGGFEHVLQPGKVGLHEPGVAREFFVADGRSPRTIVHPRSHRMANSGCPLRKIRRYAQYSTRGGR